MYFCCVRFCVSISSQEIGLGIQAKKLAWKCLQNDLFCIEWDVKTLTQSINVNFFLLLLQKLCNHEMSFAFRVIV